MSIIADLHMHSTFSDGKYNIEKVVQNCIDAELSFFCISDHDTVNHISSIKKHINDNKLEINFIPGAEITSEFNDSAIHILGYGIDSNSSCLKNLFEKVNQERIDVIYKMGEKLVSLGCNIEYQHIISEQNSPGRPHLANELVENGYALDIDEAFNKWLGKGKPGFIDKWKPKAKDVIDSIHKSGGIAVLAHVGLYKSINNMNDLLDLNLDGIEAYHPDHNIEYSNSLIEFCENYELIYSGGSDFHGWKDCNEFVGSFGLDENSFEQFYNKCNNWSN